MNVNIKYKDSVFTALFNSPEELINLYNAITNSNLPPDTPIEITTLPDVLFTDRHNDVAFVMGDRIVVFIEHQSTVNGNMPLRLLIYAARVYEMLIDSKAVYKTKMIKIPRPDFIVLYNGTEAFPDEQILRLSDAFKDLPPEELAGINGSLELTARVVNINEGRNKSLVQKSETLNGYVRFIGKIRANLSAGMKLEAAITKAVKDCIEENTLAEFLKSNSSEVINILTTEFNLEDAKVVWAEEAREEGLERGVAIGEARGEDKRAKETAKAMRLDGEPVEKIVKYTGLSIDAITALLG